MNGNVCLIFLQKAWLQWKCLFASNFAKPKKYFTVSSIIHIQIPKLDKLYNSLKIWYGRFSSGSVESCKRKMIFEGVCKQNIMFWPHYWNTHIIIRNRSNNSNIPPLVNPDDAKGRSPLTRSLWSKSHQRVTKKFQSETFSKACPRLCQLLPFKTSLWEMGKNSVFETFLVRKTMFSFSKLK